MYRRVVLLICVLVCDAFHYTPLNGPGKIFGRNLELDALKELNSEKAFDTAIKNAKDTLVVVDFATTWCGPCKVMEPKVTELSEKYTDSALFYKVTGDASADASALMKREGVRAVPSFHFWKNGERVDVVNGANIDAVTNSLQKFI
uniref:Thioredoxin domain-containing protein n=1 Tax=Aureoumbra lagunensis TaxID=44058 RepID=A0A7S3JVJ8_9STRA|mmetsp:Transcript_23250/g.30119  ORF Transcript_23250/g.30119 Transcript_23250/m.30119 type:complete len:146 (-) Transcript_23250:294-731(-)|eukprot:CAMPEP_0197291028 /NCGR_PEP_ID=MMETSP0890-20130614/11298_1 /TAXON_ID=44058 ORGANISM="Aureoumbra lagunensis, Strain CCMP1510" /NCGR_SAMPLE_ID=MMETSP0890 /ASSEMBLY_ACC=CAM_ASM_000533 /LENGTH=145 /DNA_ID=CAMNT_0042763531 /DNA_START=35 /DNA_END=472 /DNA_ORIENTATION=-